MEANNSQRVDPADSEFDEYGGTIDVGEFPDETASTETIIQTNTTCWT